ERVRADQFDRNRRLGGGGRTRHARRRRRRRAAGQLRKDVFHGRTPGDLAVHARRAVRSRDAVPAARSCQPAARSADMMREPWIDEPGGPLLSLKDVTVSFDGFKALDGLTLEVERGELRCIIGPNGAGKTTMMDVVTGKTRPHHGTAVFRQGLDPLTPAEPEIGTAGMGRKFQKPTVFERLTVVENLELSLWGDKSVWGSLVARLKPSEHRHLDDILEVIGLTDQRGLPGGSLSHGQKQWLEIGMLLMQQPDLLLVDEPVAGMTPQETEKTAELLQALKAEHTLIVVEHDMDFVRAIARRVTVLHEGRVLAEGNSDEVQRDPRVIEVYLGS